MARLLVVGQFIEDLLSQLRPLAAYQKQLARRTKVKCEVVKKAASLGDQDSEHGKTDCPSEKKRGKNRVNLMQPSNI